ncbi:Hemicentin-2 [Folsomia candida]|uniref:Hemicentin-2 n=1 Tax=Folsomia candida TaxID=158441 RepID=A0A226EPP2_FOLCA|nr:Hemicentin-2 [Folsomia candida]
MSFGLLLSGMVSGDDMRDVSEGDDVVLECRFGPHLSTRGPTVYWTRTNNRDKDNVAIEGTPLEQNYEIDYVPTAGKYDLKIKNASYDRDNGKFECRMRSQGSGHELHSKTFQLTVLLPPGPPRITPVEPSATEGRTIELTCSSSGGSPDPLIRWYRAGMPYPLESIIKNGGSRNNPTSAILSVVPQRDDDGTDYRCVVWNRALGEGEKLESSTQLNVNYYPRVKVGPENPLRVEKGSPCRLTCNVDSKPAVNSVKWTRNGRFSETSFTYTIPRVSIQDAGTYVCQAENGLGQSGESDLSLEVLYAPIVSVIAKKEIEEGENVWIKCNVSSNPRPASIEWIKMDDPNFRQTGDILRIERVSAANVGTYACKAVNIINPSGDTSTYERTGNATVTLMIKHAPGKTFIEPAEPNVVEGSGVTLNCGANPPGWPLPNFRWWKEGSESTISVGPQLNIGSAKVSSEGVYLCQPTNEIGTGTIASATLKVYQAPKIVQTLQPQILKKTGDTNFKVSCTATAKPRPSISWAKDGQILQPNSQLARGFYRIETHDIEVKNGAYTVNSTLFFTGENRPSGQILAEDRGYYACIAENEVRKEESHMYLRVQHKPIFIHQRTSEIDRVAYDSGETAHIPCKIQAFPKPEFDWFHNSLTLNFDSKHSRTYEQNLTILANDVYISTLIVHGVQEEDYGGYKCKATNSMGNSSSVITLEAKGPPSTPKHIRVIDATEVSILLQWEAGFDGGYEDTKYLVQYFSDDEAVGEASCQNPCNITGLKQQTEYNFRIKAVNDVGTSDFSKNLTGSTKVDLTKIPDPIEVKFEPKSKTLLFNLIKPMPMAEAKIEVFVSGEASWRKYRMIPLEFVNTHEHIIEEEKPLEQVRVSICFESEAACGNSINADEVNSVPAKAHISGRVPYVIGGVVSGFVVLICVGLILMFCCCRKKKIVKKDYEMGRGRDATQDAPPPYYNGMENKGMERSMDVIEDTLKNFDQQNGYISYNGLHHQPVNGNGTIPYIDQNSYSNSNNGGSVNSQDSLWKAPQLVPSDQQQINMQNQSINHNHLHATMHHQQQQQQQPHPNHRNSGNYEHHQSYSNAPDDYVSYDNRGNYATDPYGPIPKPKRRLDLIGDSPYHELSGLPDPYLEPTSHSHAHPTHNGGGHEQELPARTQPMTMTFEESLESGYSTPNSRNRRVIREIIVW